MEKLVSTNNEDHHNLQSDSHHIISEYDRIISCLQKFPQLEQRVEGLQLTSMQSKYQYFLRKF